MPPVDLDRTLSWRTATGDDATMLDELQANILHPHARDHLSVLFLSFDDAAEGRAFLRSVAEMTKSALTHLQELDAFHLSRTPGTPYVGVALAAAGYTALGLGDAQTPADPRFRDGMKASRHTLDDPPPAVWEPAYQGTIHAAVLVGDAAEGTMVAQRNAVLDLLPDSGSITVLGEETGRGQHNGNGDGIEHFGYVDGRSQPLFLDEDIADETAGFVQPTVWDPAFTLARVLVPDPGAPDPDVAHGSFLVFRKLEQNVALFKQAEEDLADALGLTGDDRERAGAMIIGRFEDGTPVTLRPDAGGPPVANNFGYTVDDQGARCPFQAHIRKTNPRGTGGFEPEPGERRHIMARRGQTYGVRLDDPDADLPPAQRPTGGVGLLFMAFNVDLAEQFEFVQSLWADNAGFPSVPPGHGAPGVDPVIGQGVRPDAGYPAAWNDGKETVVPAPAQAVTLKGGEYFFVPSLVFLRSL